MSKVLVDRDLLEYLAELGDEAIQRMGSYLAEKHGEQRHVDAARAILAAQPEDAEGLEVVAWLLEGGRFYKHSVVTTEAEADRRISERKDQTVKSALVRRSAITAPPATDALVEALDEILECPHSVAQATVPKAGIEAAPPYQVVLNVSVSLTRWVKARAVLETYRASQRKEG